MNPMSESFLEFEYSELGFAKVDDGNNLLVFSEELPKRKKNNFDRLVWSIEIEQDEEDKLLEMSGRLANAVLEAMRSKNLESLKGIEAKIKKIGSGFDTRYEVNLMKGSRATKL